MQVVIDISKEDYNKIEPFLNGQKIKGGFNLFKALEIIKNGTPLPEHHRLIDSLELSDHIKNRLIQTAMNNMETIMSYDEVCIDIVDNRIDTWINEVKTVIEGSDSE